MESEHCCARCSFWANASMLGKDDSRIFELGDAFGRCRRYPPQIHPLAGHKVGFEYAVQPMTEANDWCGEFKNRG